MLSNLKEVAHTIQIQQIILRLTTSSEIYEAESILPIKGQVKIELPRGKIMQKPAFEKLQKKKIEELKESGNDNVIVL